MQSLRKNALYNTAYQIIRLVFPLITFPYISRVLGPEGIGRVSYAQTVADYFTTFALLGIPIYAVREISRSRAVPGKLDKTFSELIVLSSLLSLVSLFLYSMLIFFLPRLAAEPSLHWTFAFVILFNWAQIDWFYQGIENYRYITIRNLALRILSIALIFLLVKEKSNYILYGGIWAASTVFSCLLNLTYSFKFIKFSFKALDLRKHFLNMLPSAVMVTTAMLYGTLNVVLLGVLVDDGKFSLGIYNAAGRLIRIAMSIIIAINTVLTPRISYMFEIGEDRKLLLMIKKSFSLTLYLAIPSTIGLMVIADDLIYIFAGTQFRTAILTMRILAPELVIMSISTIISQLLYGSRQEKKILIVTFISLINAVVANLILIPLFKQDGAAIATVITRGIETILYFVFAWTIIKPVFTFNLFKKILFANILFGAIVVLLKFAVAAAPLIPRLAAIIVFSALAYVLISWLLRLEPYLFLREWLISFLKKKNRPEAPSSEN